MFWVEVDDIDFDSLEEPLMLWPQNSELVGNVLCDFTTMDGKDAENYSPDFRLQILEQILEFSKICQLFESHQILAKYFCTTDLVIPKSVRYTQQILGKCNRFY